MNAALEKAQHFATLTGVTLGKLVYVTDVSDSPIVQPLAESRAFAMAAAPCGTGDRHKRRIARSHPDRTRRIRDRVAASDIWCQEGEPFPRGQCLIVMNLFSAAAFLASRQQKIARLQFEGELFARPHGSDPNHSVNTEQSLPSCKYDNTD